MDKPTEAIDQLEQHQRQLDMDGTFVGVSRQALDEVLAYVTRPAPTGEPVAEVHVRHGGYSMELATHIAYALPEGLNIPLYAHPDPRVAELTATIAALKAAGDGLVKFAGHDDGCDLVATPWTDPGPACDCGYTKAWQAWSAANGD